MLKIANGIWKLSLGNPEKNTPINTFKNEIVIEGLEALPQNIALPVDSSEIIFKNSSRGFKVEIPMENTEDFYGCGLQLHSVNQAGRRRYMKVNSDPIYNTGETHAPVPFFVSTAGYGIFVDTFRYATFLLGTNANRGEGKKNIEEVKEHIEFSELALYALKKAQDKRNIIIDIPAVEGVDIYFFTGPDLKTAIMRYNLFSGGGCMLPMWGLGVWYRSYGGANAQDVANLSTRLREDGLPIDVFGLEPGWHSHSYSCSYKWASHLFDKPQETIDDLNQKGFKINLWEHVFVHPTADIYDEVMPHSGDYEVWGGLVPDFALQETRDIFANYHSKEFIAKGIAGFKLDECDNSDYNPSNWSFPDSTEFPSGFDGEQMHSAMGGLYQETIAQAFKKENKRTLSQVRSSGALASSLPFVLYSDLYKHKDFIRGIVTSGFSGLLWAPEIRSCEDSVDLIRRIQSGVFSHQLLLNCWRIPNPPWYQVDINKNLAGEKMEDSEEITAICKKYFELRMSLLPYLYSAFAKYHFTGVPPVRALVMDYPEDINVRMIEDEYLFGESMLVAPLTAEDGMEKKVYLPEGIWFDFFTGKKYEGGGTYMISADMSEIPVFIRSGSIIPIAKSNQYISDDTQFEITLNCYGEGEKYFELYEDDGISFDYEKDNYNIITIDIAVDNTMKVTRKGNFEGKRYSIKELKVIK